MFYWHGCDGLNLSLISLLLTESRDLTILVQNEGEQTLRVKFIGLAGIGMLPNELEIAKHKTEKVFYSLFGIFPIFLCETFMHEDIRK